MLEDILSSSNTQRKTVSPGANLEIHSKVAEFMSLDHKGNTSRAKLRNSS